MKAYQTDYEKPVQRAKKNKYTQQFKMKMKYKRKMKNENVFKA